MKNLFLNPEWISVLNGSPEFFTINGNITFDNFELNGYKTCSITDSGNNISTFEYDLLIDVSEISYLMFGFIIRAIAVTKLLFIADFFDYNEKMIIKNEHDITTQIYHEFANVYTQYNIPIDAYHVKLKIQFEGDITACSFCAPGAYAM
ncbi:hypothetical protein JYG23_02630 [Sedimentibacter sp. zth1]|uniref:hypothetical protein n=1 Tax=Sedimentibacter sp. zth1 TaxID=2816908 RepID=UPI001A9214F9|nr:hypothetical protein [Sedimentibacter sp. zth1]QSX06375.1 hypothetical protein JYG23_02630 [Sedimentibacter sp. zth1]